MNGLLKHFAKPAKILIVGVLLLAACDAATPTPTATPQPINTVEPSAQATAAPSDTAVAAETVPAETVPAEGAPSASAPTETSVVMADAMATQAPPTAVPNDTGVSLTLPPSLAQSYRAQIDVAIPRTEGPAFGGAAPEHVVITFDQDQIQFPGNPRERQIRVYPVSGLRAIDPFMGEEIDRLQAMLERQPKASNDSIVVMPMQNAAQIFHTQLKYLDFANGSGVRFLSAYAQDVTPITNDNIFYTFQGLTRDGLYYISAFYPISSTALPNTYEESTAAQNMDEFAKTYTSKYLPGVAEGLDSLPSDQFIPDLLELDNLMQSLDAVPVLPSATAPTATVSSTDLIITATVVETPTESVPLTVVTETVESATTATPLAIETEVAATPVSDTAIISEATAVPTEIMTPTAAQEAAQEAALEATSPATDSATPSATDTAAALQPAGAATARALVNVRSLPTTQARVLTQLRRNARVQLLGRSPRSNWLYVLLEDGRRGWIAEDFLQRDIDIQSLPVLS